MKFNSTRLSEKPLCDVIPQQYDVIRRAYDVMRGPYGEGRAGPNAIRGETGVDN